MHAHDAEPREISLPANELPKRLRDRRTLFLGEGGAVYTGTLDLAPCLLTDEGTLADYLGEDDPLRSSLVTLRVFESEEHRERYIERRGWRWMRNQWRAPLLRELRDQILAAAQAGVLDRLELDELLTRLESFAGEPVGASNPLLPERLEYHEASPAGAASLICRGETIFSESFEILYGYPTSRDELVRHQSLPSDNQWRSFWRSVERMGAWEWREHDGPRHGRVGGSEWWFELAHEGRVLRLSGSGGDELGHDRLRKIVRPLRRLLDGWPG